MKKKAIPEHKCEPSFITDNAFSYCVTCRKTMFYAYRCNLCTNYINTTAFQYYGTAQYAFMRENPYCEDCKGIISKGPEIVPWLLGIIDRKIRDAVESHENNHHENI